jgi:hypothetical protein
MPTKKYKGKEPERMLAAIRKMGASRLRQIGASVSGTARSRYGYGSTWNRARLDLFEHGENFP